MDCIGINGRNVLSKNCSRWVWNCRVMNLKNKKTKKNKDASSSLYSGLHFVFWGYLGKGNGYEDWAFLESPALSVLSFAHKNPCIKYIFVFIHFLTFYLYWIIVDYSWYINLFSWESMEILQARVLEWIAMPSFKGSSQPRDWTQVSCIAGEFFTRESH